MLCADGCFNNSYLFLNYYKLFLRNGQIIMTSSIADNAKINAKRYVETTQTYKECKFLLPSGFIFQRDGAPAHGAKLAQDWIATNHQLQ